MGFAAYLARAAQLQLIIRADIQDTPGDRFLTVAVIGYEYGDGVHNYGAYSMHFGASGIGQSDHVTCTYWNLTFPRDEYLHVNAEVVSWWPEGWLNETPIIIRWRKTSSDGEYRHGKAGEADPKDWELLHKHCKSAIATYNVVMNRIEALKVDGPIAPFVRDMTVSRLSALRNQAYAAQVQLSR